MLTWNERDLKTELHPRPNPGVKYSYHWWVMTGLQLDTDVQLALVDSSFPSAVSQV